jgi:hypothetical protein
MWMIEMPALTPDDIVAQAGELSRAGDGAAAVEKLLALAGGNRAAVEAARDQVAARLHGRVDDWAATASLTLLNQALARMPRTDPLDWRVRWDRRRKP